MKKKNTTQPPPVDAPLDNPKPSNQESKPPEEPGVIPAEEGNGQVIAPTPPEATDSAEATPSQPEGRATVSESGPTDAKDGRRGSASLDFVRLGYRKNPVIGQIAKDYNLSDHDFNVYMEAALSTLNHSGRNLAENFKYLIEAVAADLTSK